MLLRILAIALSACVAYGSMLNAPFKVMDDHFSIVENPAIKSTENIPEIFQQGYFRDQHYYRPLVNFSFLIEYQLFGLNSFFYNLDNLLLHMASALLVFALVFLLTGQVQSGFWAGLLFAVHPIQWEAVCNIPGRAILLSAFFSLSAFIFFLLSLRKHWYALPLSLVCFALALLSKESAGVLPGVVFMYLLAMNKKAFAQ
jgi:4-amino-4-deoxy-L-arabinose transferase and related glycosyltransferases of PMT family